jgi:hypothetical protein
LVLEHTRLLSVLVERGLNCSGSNSSFVGITSLEVAVEVVVLVVLVLAVVEVLLVQ